MNACEECATPAACSVAGCALGYEIKPATPTPARKPPRHRPPKRSKAEEGEILLDAIGEMAREEQEQSAPSGPQETEQPAAPPETPEPSQEPDDASPAEVPGSSLPEPASEAAPTAARTMHPPPDDDAEGRDKRRHFFRPDPERERIREAAVAHFRERFRDAIEIKARFYSNPPDVYVEARHPEQGGTDVFTYDPEEI